MSSHRDRVSGICLDELNGASVHELIWNHTLTTYGPPRDAWAKHKDLDPYEAKWLYVDAMLKVRTQLHLRLKLMLMLNTPSRSYESTRTRP